MTEEDVRQTNLEVSQDQEEGEKTKSPEKEIDLNSLFPDESNDLNSLFTDSETRELLKKVQKNKKDMESMVQRFQEESEPAKSEDQE